MVIIDTSIWIPALRRRDSPEKQFVAELIRNDQAAIVGIVLAEVLRGTRSRQDFDDYLEQLQAPYYVESGHEVWLDAAQMLMELRQRGAVIPLPDALIAAQALSGNHSIYTHDEHFRRIPGLRLHEP